MARSLAPDAVIRETSRCGLLARPRPHVAIATHSAGASRAKRREAAGERVGWEAARAAGCPTTGSGGLTERGSWPGWTANSSTGCRPGPFDAARGRRLGGAAGVHGRRMNRPRLGEAGARARGVAAVRRPRGSVSSTARRSPRASYDHRILRRSARARFSATHGRGGAVVGRGRRPAGRRAGAPVPRDSHGSGSTTSASSPRCETRSPKLAERDPANSNGSTTHSHTPRSHIANAAPSLAPLNSCPSFRMSSPERRIVAGVSFPRWMATKCSSSATKPAQWRPPSPGSSLRPGPEGTALRGSGHGGRSALRSDEWLPGFSAIEALVLPSAPKSSNACRAFPARRL